MFFPENSTVFRHDTPPEVIQAARDRGENVVVLRPPIHRPQTNGGTPSSSASSTTAKRVTKRSRRSNS